MATKTWKLAIRLVKEGYSLEQCLNQEKIDEANLEIKEWPLDDTGIIYAGKAYSSPPKWKTLFTSTELPSMDNRGAVCFLSFVIETRRLFVSFGPAQIYLNDNAFERDFGLKVVLNAVDEKDLVSIDAKTPEDQSIKRRVQASHQSDISAFGINFNRDLLKGVAGKPQDRNFASLVAGSDTLFIHSKIDERKIVEKCKKILEIYESDNYKEKFPWVDYVRPIKDTVRIQELDQILLGELTRLSNSTTRTSSENTEVYLAIPEIIDHQYSAGYGFIGFGRSITVQEFPLPVLDDYLSLLDGEELSIEIIKNKHKVAQRADGSGGFFAKWSIYKCIVFEVVHDATTYILSEGDWYQVENDYATNINSYFQGLLDSTDSASLEFLEEADLSDNETTYIDKIRSKYTSEAVCLDKENIKADDWNSAIEPCDFYTKDKDFVHIKNETSSSTLSHLFMQGLVSAQVYVRSEDFRNKLKNKVQSIDSDIAGTIETTSLSTTNYRVVFAILRKPYMGGNFNLPFFSKVSLKSTADQLKDLNYKVGLYWIKKQ